MGRSATAKNFAIGSSLPKALHLCPRCKSELVQELHSGRSTFRCPRGHGYLLSTIVLRNWLNSSSHLEFDRALAVPRTSSLSCPKCLRPLSLAHFRGSEIQHCPACLCCMALGKDLNKLPLRRKEERDKTPLPLPFELRIDPDPLAAVGLKSPFELVEQKPTFPAATIGLVLASLFVTLLFFKLGQPEAFICYPRQPLDLYGLPMLFSIFTHADFMHWAGNSYFLFFAGSIVEAKLGWKKYLQLFFLSGLAAIAGSAAVSPVGVIGASGAISGVILALVATERQAFYIFRPGGILFSSLFMLSFRMPLWAWAIGWFSVNAYRMHQQMHGVEMHIGYGAHVGGAVAGTLLTCLEYFYKDAGPTPAGRTATCRS